MQSLIRYGKQFSLPALAGVFLSLSSASVDIGLFAWIGLVPLFFFLSAHGRSGKQSFIGGVVAGSLYGFAVLWPLLSLNAWWWISPDSFFWLHREALLFSVIALTALVAGGGCVGIFSYLFWRFKQHSLSDIIIFPLIWMFIERIREVFVAGFTWGHLGYNVHDYTLTLQSAKLFGVYATSGIVVATNMLVFLSLYTIGVSFSFRRVIRSRFVWALAIFLIVVNLFGYLVIAKEDYSGRNTLRVVIVHSPFSTEASGTAENFDVHLTLIEKAAGEKPNIIVLPENVFPFFVIDRTTRLPQKYEFVETPIRSMFDKVITLSKTYPDAFFLFGAHTADENQRFNSLAVMKDGEIITLYDKRVLLPLAEQVPDAFQKGHVEPLTKGAPIETLILGDIPVAPLICSEIMYPRAVSSVPNGVVINVSNDGVFENPLVARQNHIMAVLRAAESGDYLLRSTKQGISSIIDPYGRTLFSTTKEEGAILTTTITY